MVEHRLCCSEWTREHRVVEPSLLIHIRPQPQAICIPPFPPIAATVSTQAWDGQGSVPSIFYLITKSLFSSLNQQLWLLLIIVCDKQTTLLFPLIGCQKDCPVAMKIRRLSHSKEQLKTGLPGSSSLCIYSLRRKRKNPGRKQSKA